MFERKGKPADSGASPAPDARHRKSWGMDYGARLSAGQVRALDRTQRQARMDYQSRLLITRRSLALQKNSRTFFRINNLQLD